MEKFIMLFVMFPWLSGGLLAQEECPPSLVHYWNLDRNTGGFEDKAGGLTAQIENEPVAIAGLIDSARYFNGLAEVNVPDDITFDWREDDSFSIEFWIRKTSVCSGTSGLNNNVVIGRDDPNSDLHWWVGVDCQSAGKINFTLFSESGNGTIMKSKRGIIDGNWHHIAAVRDGDQNSTSIYIDSELDTSATYNYTEGFGSIVPVNIGWLNRDSKYHLDAAIDELAIYNSALTSEVISDHYNGGAGKSYCSDIGTSLSETDAENDFSVYPTVAASDFHVSFIVRNEQLVQLTAYDVTGKKIAGLINGNFKKGHYTMVFNTSDLKGNSLILLRMKVNNSILTRKLIIP